MLKMLIAFALGLIAGAFLTAVIVFSLAMTALDKDEMQYEKEQKHGER